jgi:hypothetical protein
VRVIGLLGGKGSGKTSAAAYLAETYGAKVYALADELKELVRHVFLFSQEQLHGSQEDKERLDPRWGFSSREVMERTGDALRLVYGDAFQTDRVLQQIKADAPDVAVISDVRYQHEAAQVRQAGGLLWRLRHAPGLKQWGSSHSSEAWWMNEMVDWELLPGFGVDQLHFAIDLACGMFHVKRVRCVA